MAQRMTVSEVNAKVDAIAANVEKLTALMMQVAQQQQPKAASKKSKSDEWPQWLGKCADYATSAQRAEFFKLAERAAKQRKAVIETLGTESVSCFIPVSKEADRMPHSIRWTATYSK